MYAGRSTEAAKASIASLVCCHSSEIQNVCKSNIDIDRSMKMIFRESTQHLGHC